MVQIIRAGWSIMSHPFRMAVHLSRTRSSAGSPWPRFGSFRGRILFSGMISAPLVMSEVITGLSLLVLFDITLPLLAPTMIAGWLLAFAPLSRRPLSLSRRSYS